MKRLPSLLSPFIATKTLPGPTRRESYSTPVTGGLPLCESTSAPSSSCWKVIGVILVHDSVKKECRENRSICRTSPSPAIRPPLSRPPLVIARGLRRCPPHRDRVPCPALLQLRRACSFPRMKGPKCPLPPRRELRFRWQAISGLVCHLVSRT